MCYSQLLKTTEPFLHIKNTIHFIEEEIFFLLFSLFFFHTHTSTRYAYAMPTLLLLSSAIPPLPFRSTYIYSKFSHRANDKRRYFMKEETLRNLFQVFSLANFGSIFTAKTNLYFSSLIKYQYKVCHLFCAKLSNKCT